MTLRTSTVENVQYVSLEHKRHNRIKEILHMRSAALHDESTTTSTSAVAERADVRGSVTQSAAR